MNSKLNTNLIKFSATEFPVLSVVLLTIATQLIKLKFVSLPEHIEHPILERNINRKVKIKAFKGVGWDAKLFL